MFGMGSIGNFLPMLGSIGSGFGGGGLLSLGFTLLSGLINNIGSPRNPGFENFASHPGFNNNDVHPGFGTMGGGPNAVMPTPATIPSCPKLPPDSTTATPATLTATTE